MHELSPEPTEKRDGATIAPELEAELEEKFKPTVLQRVQERIRLALVARQARIGSSDGRRPPQTVPYQQAFYAGTVPPHVKERRRKRNKAARKSRQINRRG